MVVFLFVALLSAGGLWVVSRRGSTQSVLALVPVGLLFFTLPNAAAVTRLVRGFRQIADQGLGGRAIAPWCADIWRADRLGGIGLLAVMGVAAVLQMRGASDTGNGENGPKLEESAQTFWPGVMLVASSLLIVPVAFYVFRSQQIPNIVMGMAQAMEQGQRLTASHVSQISRTVARESVLAILFGGALSLALLTFAAVNLAAVRRQSPGGLLWNYSWIVLILATLFAGWSILRATADSRLFELVLR